MQDHAPGSRSEISKRGDVWVAGDGTSRATVIKIARAIIILKPAFLVPRSTGAWSLPSPGGGGRRRLNGEGRGREVGEKGSSVGAHWGSCYGCVIWVGFGEGGKRGFPGAREGPGGRGRVIYSHPLPRGIIYREDFRESTQRTL